MTRSQADHWSLMRSLAFLAATFAVVLGTLLPFGAMAAARPGEPLVICSVEGPRTVQVGADLDGPAGEMHAAECAACVLPLLAALPAPPAPEPATAPTLRPESVPAIEAARPRPPVRAPPRPPSTAPPQA